MKMLIFAASLLLFFAAERARAEECPWAGATVTVNTQSLAAGDYDCSTQDITVAGGQTLTVGTVGVGGVILRANSLNVVGIISADGQGYGAGGPGNGTDQLNCGGGASHGGLGTSPLACGHAVGGIAAVYGSQTQPTAMGSGGGLSTYYGGLRNGGGAIKIVSNSLAVSGSITANGLNGPGDGSYCSGAGSGGSIWLDVGAFSGNGVISANGGTSPRSTNAGGGRIAIYSQSKTYTGSVTASATSTAGAGTVFEISNGMLVCTYASTQTVNATDFASSTVTGVVVDNGCNITVSGSLTVNGPITVGQTATAALTILGNTTATQVDLYNAATFSVQGDLAVTHTVTLNNTSRLIPLGNTSTGFGTILTAPTVTIYTGASIDATGTGYGAGGPGNGLDQINCGGGASHGGFGTAPTTCGGAGSTIAAKYGSQTQPLTLGSGGGYSSYNGGLRNGGGAIKIIANDLQVNGSIKANGLNGPGDGSYCSGGGSGGSIWLDIGTLSGNGAISADGGISPRGTHGGGGRVAIYYVTKTHTGTVSAAATSTATAGTVFMMSNSNFQCVSATTQVLNATDFVNSTLNGLVVDNGCNLTINGVLTVNGSITVGQTGTAALAINGNTTATQVELFNAATFSIQGDLTVGSSLTLYGTSRLIPVGNTTTGVGTVLIAPTVTIGATAAIDSNGQGYGAGGPGNGMDQFNCGGGASYGGFGTAPNTCGAAGTTIAAKYGSLTQPVSLGSGGGLSTQYGGARNGGGAIKIVADSLAVNGALRSNGLNGPGDGSYCSGGGSGGSIWLEVGTLSGNGPISANGGTSPRSTNAGGGRIAIYYQTKTYTGSVTASATSTATAGTVYMMRSGKYISPVMDFGSSAISYETLAYTATTPTTSSVSVDIRAGNTVSPDGSWTGWSTIINGGSLAAFVGNRYLQYRATLGSEDASKPSLDSITINTPFCYNTGSYYYVKTSSINQFKYARSNTLSNVSITSSQPGSTALKSLVSFDGGSTWKKHNGTTWIDAAGGVSTVGTMGNTIADLSTGLTGYTFGASEPTLDFAFGLETDSCSATPSITELRFDY